MGTTKQEEKGKEETLPVLFSKSNLSSLTKTLQRALEQYETREIAGVAPSWKPEQVGEFVVGEVVRESQAGQFGGTVLVMETPSGFVSVWLNADLKIKLGGETAVGKKLVIQFDGWLKKTDNPKLKNDMRSYRVIEVLGPRS